MVVARPSCLENFGCDCGQAIDVTDEGLVFDLGYWVQLGYCSL